MPRRTFLIVTSSVVVVLAVVVVVIVVTYRRPSKPSRPPDPNVIIWPTTSIMILDQPFYTLPGMLSVDATATRGPDPIADHLWWFIHVRQINPATGFPEIVKSYAYPERGFDLAIGQRITATFSKRLRMPAGKYNVLVGLRGSHRMRHEDGSVTTGEIVCADSDDVTVR